MGRRGKSEAGRTLDDRTHDDQPSVRDAEMPARRVRLRMVGDCPAAEKEVNR